MRTRIKARRIWRQTRGRRRQGSGLVGGIASVATRASRAQPRAGSRSTRIGNDESSGQHGQPGVDDFAEGTTAPRPRDAPRVSSTRTLRRRSEKVWRLFFHFLAKRKSLAPPDPQCAACRTWASPHGLPPPIRLIQKFPPASFTPLQTLFGPELVPFLELTRSPTRDFFVTRALRRRPRARRLTPQTKNTPTSCRTTATTTRTITS